MAGIRIDLQKTPLLYRRSYEKILKSGKKEIRTKLDLYVSVENFNYRIRSGFGTWFAKCVLLSLAKMDLSELSSPIKITLRLTDNWDYNTKVCSLYNYKGVAFLRDDLGIIKL